MTTQPLDIPTMRRAMAICETAEREFHDVMMTKKPGSAEARKYAHKSEAAETCKHMLGIALRCAEAAQEAKP